jgi:hypothetical protein
MRRSSMLPTFLVIGTMKGGTTSLYNYLRDHPQVFMSTTKELHYFVAEKNLSRGNGWYERNFRDAGDAVAVGEASPDYTKYPIYQGVPQRIAETMPGVKLIYVLRDPVERIRSHYLHDVARGRERRPIGEVVPGNVHYLAPSRYALQIDRYLEHFPREQLLVLTSEDLRTDRRATMRRVHEFIGVDADWSAPVQEREFNGIASKAAPGLLVRAARNVPGASRLRLLAPRQVMAVERLLRTSKRPVDVQAGTISDELRRRLVDELAPDLERLRSHMGDGFEAWGLRG